MKASQALAIALGLASLPFGLRAAVQNCSWVAGPGVWESAINWSCGLIPNNNATNDFNVSIGDVAVVDGVTLRTGEGIFHLTVESGSKLYFTNNANLLIYNFPNAMTGYPEQELAIGGDIVFENSGAGAAALSFEKGDMTLRGFGGVGGTIWLTNSGSSIDGITANANEDTRLLLIEGTTIRGAGQITDLALKVAPQCTILADQGGTLRWRANTTFFSSTNQGVLEAANNSTNVFIFDGQTDFLAGPHVLYNGGGLVAGINGGAVELQNGFTIIGGDLQTVGTGRVRGGGELQDITLDYSSYFDVTGRNGWIDAIHNEGVFTVMGNNAIVTDSPWVTLDGGGSVLLSTNGGGNISQIDLAGGSLRNVDNWIHGQGYIQDVTSFSRVLDNEGRIEADIPGSPVSGYLWLYPYTDVAYTWTNSGTLSAANGGVLWVGAGGQFSLANSNGLIVANSNSIIRLVSPKIYNGTISANGSNAVVRSENAELHDLLITTTNGGLVAVADFGSSVSTRIYQVLNRGDIVVSNSCNLYLSSDVTNEGRIFLDPAATLSTYLSLLSDITVSGGGSIELNGVNTSYLNSQSGPWRLVNNGNTIRGTGRIQSVWLVNQGTLDADAATPLYFTAPVLGPWTNNGVVKASGAGGLEITDPLLVNLGTVQINAGSHIGLSSGGGIRQDAGELTVDGAISNQFSSGSVVINAGTLRGSGIIYGAVTNSGGNLSPGDSPGKLAITGNFTQQTNGTLNIEIGGTTPGTDYDQLIVAANATLGGSLTVNFINGFQPSPGDAFQVLACSSRSSTFNSTTGLAASNGVVLLPQYNTTNVSLLAVARPSLVQPATDGSAFRASFASVSGVSYQVEFTGTLSPPVSWQPLGGPIPGTGSLLTITNSPLVSTQQFYRISLQ